MSGSFLLALSYALLAVFLLALVVRSLRLARMPVHLRWELAPIPKEKNRGHYGGSYLEEYEWWKKPREESMASELAYMLKEIFFLKALREHNRSLWWVSFPFHMGLYLLIVAGGGLVVGGLLDVIGIGGLVRDLIDRPLPWLAVTGHALGLLGALGLLVHRLGHKLRPVTTPVAYFNLALPTVLFATGLLASGTTDAFIPQTQALVGALLTAQPPPELPAWLGVHWAVTLAFLAYLPFSQMMHFVAKYFTYHQVRWDDRPLQPGGRMERQVKELLQQPVSWAGPHVGADGTKTWVDIATEEAER